MLVSENRFRVNRSNQFISRCIDGRYKNEDVAALALCGADGGELALLYATASQYGFKIDEKKALEVLTDVVGGEKNLRIHSDTHAQEQLPAAGCGHMKQMRTDMKSYGLEEDQIVTLNKQLDSMKKNGAKEVVLEGDHQEGAVLQVVGEWGVRPQYVIESSEGNTAVQVFIHHQTLVDRRHKELAKRLIESKAVILADNLDADYLYQVMSEVTENHLMETAKRLAKGLPIYLVKFADDGTFELTEMGSV